MPAFIAPEGFQTHQSFVADQTPELSGAFEAALILPTGRFDGAAALRFALTPCGGVVHSLTVAFQIRQFGLNGLSFFLTQSFGQSAQIVQQRRDPSLLEFLEQRFDPGPRGRFILRVQRVGHGPQMSAGVIVVQPLDRKSVV